VRGHIGAQERIVGSGEKREGKVVFATAWFRVY